ncbi:hypothetical protein GCK72_026170 [Caenorhabditis remanei]|uniref:Uncharacterized protein n=1 Tax=Caenorhabditis remanei TaxID=31234 RepID=A0A6A5G4S4_CAERE|nr:hypothetical protein GCK72_026170 [Caenorhabditis remanei]KAF1749702.1 hypothetical protein GCK72_026170 [Caenorhabditis remanei]
MLVILVYTTQKHEFDRNTTKTLHYDRKLMDSTQNLRSARKESKVVHRTLHLAGTLMNGRSNTRKEFNQPRDTKMMRSQSNA